MKFVSNIARRAAAGAALAACAAFPAATYAAQGTATGVSPSVGVNLNFQVVVPKFLLFRVGSAGAVVDTIEFQPTPTELADALDSGTPNPVISATAASGDLTNGQVTVRLVSNGGQVTITETNNGGGNGLSDGGAPASFIPYSDITTTDTGGNLTPPTLSNAGGGTSLPAPTSGPSVTVRNSSWTYTYNPSPTTVPGDGTYTGVVTYTAATP